MEKSDSRQECEIDFASLRKTKDKCNTKQRLKFQTEKTFSFPMHTHQVILTNEVG